MQPCLTPTVWIEPTNQKYQTLLSLRLLPCCISMTPTSLAYCSAVKPSACQSAKLKGILEYEYIHKLAILTLHVPLRYLTPNKYLPSIHLLELRHMILICVGLSLASLFAGAMESHDCICSFFNDLRIALCLLINCHKIDWLITKTLFQLLLIGRD